MWGARPTMLHRRPALTITLAIVLATASPRRCCVVYSVLGWNRAVISLIGGGDEVMPAGHSESHSHSTVTAYPHSRWHVKDGTWTSSPGRTRVSGPRTHRDNQSVVDRLSGSRRFYTVGMGAMLS